MPQNLIDTLKSVYDFSCFFTIGHLILCMRQKTVLKPKIGQEKRYLPRPTDYGGALRNTRRGRSGPRALAFRYSMHIVLRSSKCQGKWSLTYGDRRARVLKIIKRQTEINAIRLINFANVGNHLHLHIQLPKSAWVATPHYRRYKKRSAVGLDKSLLTHTQLYKRFIRGLSSAVAMLILGAGLTANLSAEARRQPKKTFWDLRPYSRIVASQKHFLQMADYMLINRLEGEGIPRISARFYIAELKDRKTRPDLDDS